jgi:hypothetical protein
MTCSQRKTGNIVLRYSCEGKGRTDRRCSPRTNDTHYQSVPLAIPSLGSERILVEVRATEKSE